MSLIITNLRIPWSTALPQDNSFNVSRNELEDPLNQIVTTGPLDWGGTNFDGVGTLNGLVIADFLLNIASEVLGDLADVDPDVSISNLEGDILFYDGANWNRIPRGLDGEFLKSTSSGIAWGGGALQVADFNDDVFTIHDVGNFNNAFRFNASLITTTLPTVRTFILPDEDGTIALITDIPIVGSTFEDSAFNLVDDKLLTPPNIKQAFFNVSGLPTGSPQTYTLPGTGGLLALFSDITPGGDVFDDDVFRVRDNVQGPVNPKQFAFQLDQLTTNTTITIRPLTTANKIFDIPDAVDGDEFLMETFAQTILNKSIDLANNTITGTRAEFDTAVSDGDFVFPNQVNVFQAGFRQTFTADLAGTAGLNIDPIAGDPSTKVDGDMWLNSSSGIAFIRIGGVDKDFTSALPIDTSFIVTISDESTDLDTTNNPKTTFRMPFGYVLSEVRASVRVAAVGSQLLTIDIQQNNVSILSTNITLDSGEKTSTTATTPPVISTATLTDDAEIEIRIDQIGETTPGQGLKVYLIGMHV